MAAQPIPAKSIAVLPFVNMSGDAKNDYFSDGITEEILDALAQVPDPSLRERAAQALETSPANSDVRRDVIVHALFPMYLNAPDRALAVLEAGATRSTIPQLLWHSEFDPVRNDPRFKSVLKKMRLPYTPMATTPP